MVLHDRSYARWKGDRAGRVRPVPIVLEAGLKRGLGLIFKRKLPAILMILAAYGPFIFGICAVYFAWYVRSNVAAFDPGLVEALGSEEFTRFTTANPETVFFYMANLQWPFLLVLCVLVGTGLIAEDRRANALELYLSRPVTVQQYLLGKLGTIACFLAAVTVLPTALLIAAQISVSWTEPGRALELLALLAAVCAAGALWVLLPALTVLAASALSSRTRTATILWLSTVFMLEFVAGPLLVEVFAEASWNLLRIGFNLRQVMAAILGSTADVQAGVSLWASAAVLAFWAALSVAILLRRVRPVEVVA